jgi:hypothetical protein
MADSPHHAHQAMAHTAAFDVSAAIGRWREGLSGSSAFRPDDLEELESHVRDSIASLEAAGLSTREAFWVATNRVGTADALDREYGKVHADRVWLDRALWMVAGSLGIQAVASLVSWVSSLSEIAAYQVTGRMGVMGPVGLAAYLVMALAAFAALWRSGQRGRGVAWQVAAWIKAHPVGSAIGVALFFGFNALSRTLIAILANTVMPVDSWESILRWRGFTLVLPVLFWPAVLGWLLRRRARTFIAG